MSLFATLLGPIVTLGIGALVFYVSDRLLKPQDKGIAEVVVLVLALGFLWGAHEQIGQPVRLGDLSPAMGAEMLPFLLADRMSWLLALLVLAGALAAALLSLGQPTEGRAGRAAAWGGALLFLFAGDWATLALAWVLVDIGLVYALNEGQEQTTSLQRVAPISLAGAAILGVALLLWQRADGSIAVDRHSLTAGTFTSGELPPWVAPLLLLAAWLRLMPFPLPIWQAASKEKGQSVFPVGQMIAFGMPMLLGTALWTRLAAWGVPAQGGQWLSALALWAAVWLFVAALKTWAATGPHEVIGALRVCGSGSLLLASALSLPATWQLAIGIAIWGGIVALSVSWSQCPYFDLHNPASYWRAAPATCAILSLFGLPLTIGFPARVAFYGAVFEAKKWLVLLLSMASEALIFGVLLRILLEVECVPVAGSEEGERPDQAPEQQTPDPLDNLSFAEMVRACRSRQGIALVLRQLVHLARYRLLPWLGQMNGPREIGYGVGAVLACGLAVLGIRPDLLSVDRPLEGLGHWFGMPTLPIWAALLLPAIGGLTLYRRQDALLSWVHEWWPLVERLLSLNWLYWLAEKGLAQVRTLIQGITLVIEGAGYMAWVLLACLIILLFVISR